MAGASMYAVKARKKDEKRFLFVASGGRLTSLRVHAGTFPSMERAIEVAESLSKQNADYEFQIRALRSARRPG